MTTKTVPKRKNPADLTLRNLHALHKRLEVLEANQGVILSILLKVAGGKDKLVITEAMAPKEQGDE